MNLQHWRGFDNSVYFKGFFVPVRLHMKQQGNHLYWIKQKTQLIVLLSIRASSNEKQIQHGIFPLAGGTVNIHITLSANTHAPLNKIFNCFQTELAKIKVSMQYSKEWEYFKDTNNMCKCGGNFQAIAYLLAWKCVGEPCTNEEPTKATNQAIICPQFWT